MFKWIKKNFYCRFIHWRHRCYPEVDGRGLEGPWHCTRCHPCGEEIDALLKSTISPNNSMVNAREEIIEFFKDTDWMEDGVQTLPEEEKED